MKPPSWLAPNPTAAREDPSIRCDVDCLVQTISAPACSHIVAATALADTGTATRQPSLVDSTSDSSARSASLSESTCPVSSAMVMCSPSGWITAPRCEPEAFTSSPTMAACCQRSKVTAPDVDAYGLTASTSAPVLLSTLGITKLAVP